MVVLDLNFFVSGSEYQLGITNLDRSNSHGGTSTETIRPPKFPTQWQSKTPRSSKFLPDRGKCTYGKWCYTGDTPSSSDLQPYLCYWRDIGRKRYEKYEASEDTYYRSSRHITPDRPSGHPLHFERDTIRKQYFQPTGNPNINLLHANLNQPLRNEVLTPMPTMASKKSTPAPGTSHYMDSQSKWRC